MAERQLFVGQGTSLEAGQSEFDLFGYPDSLIRARCSAAYSEGISRVPLEGRIVADIGSGHGHGVSSILLEQPELTLSGERHARFLAKQRVALRDSASLQFVRLNLQETSHLPVKEGSLDAIFFIHVIEHIPPEQMPHVLNDFNNSLKSRGKIIIATPNEKTLVAPNPMDEKVYTFDELSDLLGDHFDDVLVLSLVPNKKANSVHNRKRLLARFPGARTIRDYLLPTGIQERILGSGEAGITRSDFSYVEGEHSEAIDFLAIAEKRE